jgi:uncharacterized damage-inducible protein DinB
MPGSPTDDEGAALVAVPASDYLWFVDLVLGDMNVIVEDLGDELVNRRPPFRDANSAYAILNHCLGVMEYWGGATIAERPIQRDRAAEFAASGDVAGLLRRSDQARRRLREDLVGLVAEDTPVNVRGKRDHPVPYTETKGAVLLHVLKELSQHLGQMELTRDALVASRRH